MSNIQVGDTVECIDDGFFYVSKGEKYKVLEIEKEEIILEGVSQKYPCSCFKKVSNYSSSKPMSKLSDLAKADAFTEEVKKECINYFNILKAKESHLRNKGANLNKKLDSINEQLDILCSLKHKLEDSFEDMDKDKCFEVINIIKNI